MQNYMHITIHTSQAWADTFISELMDTHVEMELRTKHIPPQVLSQETPWAVTFGPPCEYPDPSVMAVTVVNLSILQSRKRLTLWWPGTALPHLWWLCVHSAYVDAEKFRQKRGFSVTGLDPVT